MNFKNLSDETKERILAIVIAGMVIVLFYTLMNNLGTVGSVLRMCMNAVSPFLFGLLFTLILNPLRKLVENSWLKKTDMKPRTKRAIAVLVSELAFICMLVLFCLILIPQLFDSLMIFTDSVGGYIRQLQHIIANLDQYSPELAAWLEKMVSTGGTSLTEWLGNAAGGMSAILNYGIGVAKVLMNLLIGIVISVYVLFDEERFKRQVKMVLYGYLNEKTADDTMHLLRLIKNTFNNFIFGKFVDSLIIGFLCYVGCVILKIPYAPMIAVIIGVTNMIPVFGPFIGAIPCIFILLIINPVSALIFGVFILVLQQIDGNIIGPRILGGAVGLPTLWVTFAIIVGGALFGIIGMFIGVPCFSVIYELTKERSENNLARKQINVNEK